MSRSRPPGNDAVGERHRDCWPGKGVSWVPGRERPQPDGAARRGVRLSGPNGAGKTTTIMMLLGNIRPTTGHATLLGKPIGDVATRRHVDFFRRYFEFHEFLTALEFLDLHGEALRDERRGAPSAGAGRSGSGRVGGSWNSRIREFSKGMQQRIGLAQALLHGPDLVILDEPTSRRWIPSAGGTCETSSWRCGARGRPCCSIRISFRRLR